MARKRKYAGTALPAPNKRSARGISFSRLITDKKGMRRVQVCCEPFAQCSKGEFRRREVGEGEVRKDLASD